MAIGKIYTFDDDDVVQPVDDTASDVHAPAAPKRKPGRPRGAKTATTKTDGRLLSADFAFLRAVVLGIAPKEAADRYLTNRDHMDQRSAAAYEAQLRRKILALVNTMQDAQVTEKARLALNRLTAPSGKPSSKVAVTFEAFAARFPDGMYGENELIEMYQEQYGKSESAADAALQQARKKYEEARSLAVAALNWLSDRLGVRPEAQESCALWLEERLADGLATIGVTNLGELVAWINERGRRWYEAIPNVGRTRARRLVAFLLQHEDEIGLALNSHIRAGQDPRYQLDAQASTDASSIVLAPAGLPIPLDQLDWPADLRGELGYYRNRPEANDYGAQDDFEAVRKWLKSLERKSPATQDTYYRAIERLVLWSVLVKRKALSSLDENDFHQFEQFLRNPPADWTSPVKAQKWSREWRPFRGPLSHSSVLLNMRVISSMYSTWNDKGYLRTNPLPKLESTAQTVDPDEPGSAARLQTRGDGIDVTRSFTDRDIGFIREHFAKIPEGMEKNRLRAIILLLQTSGLRRAEAVSLNWGNLRAMDFGYHASGDLKINVLGKGGKVREVPLKPETLQALEVHYRDRQSLVQGGKLHCGGIAREDTPLLSILDERLTVSAGRDGHAPEDAVRTGNKTGRLSTGRLYKILKDFFAGVARSKDMDGVTAEKFRRASTHWMRHTFAHQALHASGNDLRVVQDLLGHADISTTVIYTKANLEERARVVNGISASLG